VVLFKKSLTRLDITDITSPLNRYSPYTLGCTSCHGRNVSFSSIEWIL